MTPYPEALLELKQGCTRYRRKAIREEELQSCLWKAVQTIVAVEEKELRDYLRSAEGRVELLRFTVNQNQVYEEVLKLVEEIEGYIQKLEDASATDKMA
jgi:hypothetical protein